MQPITDSTAFRKLLYDEKDLSLILLNIDNFSSINNYFGIKNGNYVFEFVEKMLRQFQFTDITVYKLESDEFALVYMGSLDNESLAQIASEVSAFFNEAELDFDDGLSVKISFSIGIASGKGLTVLNEAKLAIQELREYTRGTFNIYDIESPYMQAIHKNIYWVTKIQESVAEDLIIPFFQPIIDNKTNKIVKYECLARIQDGNEFVSPYHFMDAAKETRLISFITKSMIKQSCRKLSKTDYGLSINITNDDLELKYLEDYLLRNTSLYGIDPSRVTLELLEDISSLNKGTIIEQLSSLKEKGFKIAIDDFGSESSNFSRLLEFTPDYIKIDGAFIKDVAEDEKCEIMTKGIVSIAQHMGIEIIAEFVHSKEVQEKVISLGIDYSQGYLFSPPLKDIAKES